MPDQPSAAIAPDHFANASTTLFAGLRRYCRFDDRASIPAMWQGFGPMIGTIPDEVRVSAYGLILAPADQDGDRGFDYFAAAQVKSLEDLPEDLSDERVGGRKWAIFKHTGHVSGVGMTCGAAGDWLAQSDRAPKTGSMAMIEHCGAQCDSRTRWVPGAGSFFIEAIT